MSQVFKVLTGDAKYYKQPYAIYTFIESLNYLIQDSGGGNQESGSKLLLKSCILGFRGL